MEKFRVYVVNIETEPFTKTFDKMTDEEFMEHAEKQGGVYTLKGFEKEFNNTPFNNLSTEYDVIRIIEVK